MSLSETLRDISKESALNKAEKLSLRLIAKEYDKGILISIQHAISLRIMVKWFKTMIEVRGVDTLELTAEYCDELIKDLSKKE